MVSRDRDKRRTEPPYAHEEEKPAPGPFEELFLKPSRPLDLEDTSPARRDVFAGEPQAKTPATPQERESIIFSPFTPTSPTPPAFAQPATPPPGSGATSVSKPGAPSFEKLVEELVPAPDAEAESPPARSGRISAMVWLLVALVAALAGAAWLLRDRLVGSPAAPPGAVEPASPQLTSETPLSEGQGSVLAASDAGPATETAVAVPPAAAPQPTAEALLESPPPAPAAALAGVSWRLIADGTEVTIRTDGFLAPQRVRVNVLTSPPRVLVRLAQVFPGKLGEHTAVATGGVERIRLGYHGELSPPQLYVVLDLASPAVTLAEHAVEGDTVRLVLRRPRRE